MGSIPATPNARNRLYCSSMSGLINLAWLRCQNFPFRSLKCIRSGCSGQLLAAGALSVSPKKPTLQAFRSLRSGCSGSTPHIYIIMHKSYISNFYFNFIQNRFQPQPPSCARILAWESDWNKFQTLTLNFNKVMKLFIFIYILHCSAWSQQTYEFLLPC